MGEGETAAGERESNGDKKASNFRYHVISPLI
jgi:hypothetical protein